jgi:hypothetical protein
MLPEKGKVPEGHRKKSGRIDSIPQRNSKAGGTNDGAKQN